MEVLHTMANEDKIDIKLVQDLQQTSCTMCNIAASLLQSKLGIAVRASEFMEIGFGGLAFAFGPGSEGQPVPEELEHIDEGGDWENV